MHYFHIALPVLLFLFVSFYSFDHSDRSQYSGVSLPQDRHQPALCVCAVALTWHITHRVYLLVGAFFLKLEPNACEGEMIANFSPGASNTLSSLVTASVIDHLPKPSLITDSAKPAYLISISSQGLLVTSKKVTIKMG